jgi:hypothetical protein
MAGSFETLQSVTKIGPTIIERLITLEYVSDAAADGTVPDAEIENLENYVINEVITFPSADKAPAAYRVLVEDEDGGALFLSTARSTTVKERVTGNNAAIDSPITVKIVKAADTDPAEIGNAKEFSVTLRLRRKAL